MAFDTWFLNGRRTAPRVVHACLVACMAVSLGCSSPAEKANRFFERGSALLHKGDLAKARVEFLNALQLRDDLVAAWYGLAQVAEKQGDLQRLYELLNSVVERDPKFLPAQIKLGRMLLSTGKLDKALQYSDAALALDRDNPEVLALRAAVLYKLDDPKGAVEQAQAALAKDANNVDALVVLATERLAAGDADKAVEYLDQGLQQNERSVPIQLIKVQALEKLARMDSAEESLRKLIHFYPETHAFRHILARLFLRHGAQDKALAEYRSVVGENPQDTQAKLELVRFVASVKGLKAAAEELQTFIRNEPENNELQFAKAALYQAQHDPKAAEKIYTSIIAKDADSSDALMAKGLLATSLLAAGHRQAATALTSEILAKDQRNEQGVLLKASMALDDHQPEAAIADLRNLLKDVPSSARGLLLLAKAHELAGSPDLADEHYLKAFKASRMAPDYGTTYASFLIKRGQATRAEKLLEQMLAATPGHIPAEKLLAQLRISQGDWAGAQEVASEVRLRGDQGQLAEQILGALHADKKEHDASISAYKRLYEATPDQPESMVSLVRAYVLAGKTDEALNFVRAVLQSSPDNTGARLLQGQLEAIKGDLANAATSFQTVISREPNSMAGYLSLSKLYMHEQRYTDADNVISQGLAVRPDDFALRVARANLFERSGQIEQAIQLYEELIRNRPGADILVNNLVSLLVDHRADTASLKRANELALRFKQSEVPQFKDTLGWSYLKTGKPEQAHHLIEAATKQLPDLPVFRYHLGMTHLALNNRSAARQELEKALALGKKFAFAESEQVKQALKGL